MKSPPVIQLWSDARSEDRFSMLIRDASRAFTKTMQLRFAQHGVPFGFWAYLRVLYRSDGITQRELSARAGLKDNTTFIALRTMEADGYVVRKQVPSNKKNMYVHLTPKGRSLLRKLVPLADEPNLIALKDIPQEDVQTARLVLLKVIESLADDELQQLALAKRKKL